MLKNILIAIVAIVLMFVAIVTLQPSAFRITRTATIAAPPETVFAQVNDLHKWAAWSPWAKLDPAMKVGYEGAPAGTGAIHTWSGNKDVGEGRLTIIDSHPSDLIRMKLEMLKPFAATNAVEFSFKPEGNATVVTWSMNGESNFIAKAIHLFMDVDKMVGGDFEKGLAQLKTVAEAGTRS